ncbi:circularly permuted type 2 ATP-grasp protein [Desulfosediminicola flagellatus]|uniref:circularly permuted type 2 ATP-grasp protein n=1 Tax=Desulfosediminicola flagellatus TaxID=2569541 RepID=UPI0010AD6E12|nr:circularly permuted type 2 ATP-grasp protein [Desulfosediminicola flagellatus]
MSNPVSDSSSASVKTFPSIFETNVCPPGSYCEAFDSQGLPRLHWQSLLETLDQRGRAQLESDYERAKRMRHEDGATINPYDDLTEQTTSWALDMIPLPIAAKEWTQIEAGVKQRMGLLEEVLRDTYGAQLLLKNGNLPSELIYANPNFLHECYGIQPSGNRYLTFYAADLYRGEDGQFRVFRDYGMNPAGLGYALENRLVTSRVFSGLYHKTQIRRLASFFQTFHRAFIERSSLRKSDPGIVLFSPGPDSNIYFEHALLSRYLGYPLVEGQDLTVRNGKVFLKKLADLEPVEAIFRHVDDQISDPFAFRRRETKGVAGLLQVCREQNVDIVNPIGSGFIETPALQTFLPHLCRDLLGEELLLQNHSTWWCGNRNSLDYVLSNVAQLTINSAMERSGSFKQSADFLADIQSAPSEYIASSALTPSVSPAWDGSGVARCFNMIRVFACATENGFSVMPGGLAITADNSETLILQSPEKQKSKDIWILSDEPVELISLMSGMTSIPEFKRTSDLPNRVADNLLWLGRYLERAEGLVRILRSTFRRLSGEDKPENVPELKLLLHILQAKHVFPASVEGVDVNELDLAQHLHDALYRKDSSESVVTILRRVQETARNVRDRLSIDCTRILNRMENFRENTTNDPVELLDEIVFTLSAFSGLAMESMTRGLGWSFMDMGRRLERAMNQAVLIRLAIPHICNDSHDTLQALLEICDSLMTYRGRYRSSFQLAPVLDLLLADEGNPKSLAFQFNQISSHVEQLPRKNEKRFSSKEECCALDLLTGIRLLDLTRIECGVTSSEIEKVIEFLIHTERKLKELGQEVSAHYLTRVPSTPHFAISPGNQIL